MNKAELINQLYNLRKLVNQDECEKFENILTALSGSISVEDIVELCKVLDDDTNEDEVMFGVIHLMETLAGYDYLRCIATFSPLMIDGKNWAMILNKRILNSKKYYPEYVRVIKSLNEKEKARIFEILIAVKNDNISRFGEKIDFLLQGC